MYETLLALIGTTLSEVTEVADYFAYPKTDLTEFPAVYYQPGAYQNRFETNSENYKIYRFDMTVMAGGAGATVEQLFTVVLPKTVDAIIAKFDNKWNGGTVGGHRIYVSIDSAEPWIQQNTQDGVSALAPLNVEIKVVTNV